jgi:hypothetical protein
LVSGVLDFFCVAGFKLTPFGKQSSVSAPFRPDCEINPPQKTSCAYRPPFGISIKVYSALGSPIIVHVVEIGDRAVNPGHLPTYPI